MISDDKHFILRLAQDDRDLRAAQRLRYEVFVQELGAKVAFADHDARLERDEFDPYFDHLLLIDPHRAAEDLQDVVGVYRLLPSDRLAATGRFYSESEFDLTALKVSGRKLLELGRSCVHADYRGGTAMLLLTLFAWIRDATAEFKALPDHHGDHAPDDHGHGEAVTASASASPDPGKH